MSRLNLEALTTFSLLDSIVSPAVPETTSGGSDSFGTLFERARSALNQSSPSTASPAKDASPTKDSHAAENQGATKEPHRTEEHGPADDLASRERSDASSKASPPDADHTAEKQESSEARAEASKEPEATEVAEVKPEDDSADTDGDEEISGAVPESPLPAEASATDGAPATGTLTESESGDEGEMPSEGDSDEDDDQEAAALVVAAVVDGTVPVPQTPSGETGTVAEGDADMASGARLVSQPVGAPPLPKQAAGAAGQPGTDPPAAAAETAAAADGASPSTTAGDQASQGQAEIASMPPSRVVDSEGGQREGDSDQANDRQNRPSRRSESDKSPHDANRNELAVAAPSASAAGQGGTSPQVDVLPQTGLAASQVASSVAAVATGAATSGTAPSESKGSESSTSEVSGGQQVTQEQSSQGARPQASGDQSGVSQADRVRFVQRVARAFESVGEQGGTIRLKLHPPELGALRLEVTVRGGAMTARLEAETPAAQGMLLENLSTLRERLAEQNIRVERFDVDLMGQSSGGPTDGTGAQTQSGRDQPQPRPYYGNQRSTGVESGHERRRPATAGGTSRFDVIV